MGEEGEREGEEEGGQGILTEGEGSVKLTFLSR